MEPLTTAVRAIRTNRVQAGSFIVILGPGTFGLFILQSVLAYWSQLCGYGWLEAPAGIVWNWLSLGANEKYHGDEMDPVRVKRIDQGKGADLVVEATGRVER